MRISCCEAKRGQTQSILGSLVLKTGKEFPVLEEIRGSFHHPCRYLFRETPSGALGRPNG